MADDKPTKAAQTTGRSLGATGEAVRKNIRRIRDDRGISGPELSARLKALDRPIPPLGIHRIENGSRRVDVDDLMALAVALEVSPATLLMPVDVGRYEPVTVTGYEGQLTAESLWDWLSALDPLPGSVPWPVFLASAWPSWKHAQIADEPRRRSLQVEAEVRRRREGRKVRALDADLKDPGVVRGDD